MNIDELLNQIETFDCDNYSKPSQLSIILGCDSVNANRVDHFSEKTNIDVYKSFKEVAFLFEEFTVNPSEIFVLGILLGSLDFASKFLNKVNELENGYEKFINYLYFKENVILVNRSLNLSQFIQLTKQYQITNVLVVGKKPIPKKIIRSLGPKTFVGQILHCSPINLSINPDEFFNVWFLHDNSSINKVESFARTNFESFNIIRNNINKERKL